MIMHEVDKYFEWKLDPDSSSRYFCLFLYCTYIETGRHPRRTLRRLRRQGIESPGGVFRIVKKIRRRNDVLLLNALCPECAELMTPTSDMHFMCERCGGRLCQNFHYRKSYTHAAKA